MVEGGRTPLLSAAELGELGFKIVVFPLSGLFSATKAMERCLTYLRKNGSTYGYSDMLTFKEFEAVVDVPGYRALEKKFTVSST